MRVTSAHRRKDVGVSVPISCAYRKIGWPHWSISFALANPLEVAVYHRMEELRISALERTFLLGLQRVLFTGYLLLRAIQSSGIRSVAFVLARFAFNVQLVRASDPRWVVDVRIDRLVVTFSTDRLSLCLATTAYCFSNLSSVESPDMIGICTTEVRADAWD
jgi:hypothetical protein